MINFVFKRYGKIWETNFVKLKNDNYSVFIQAIEKPNGLYEATILRVNRKNVEDEVETLQGNSMEDVCLQLQCNQNYLYRVNFGDEDGFSVSYEDEEDFIEYNSDTCPFKIGDIIECVTTKMPNYYTGGWNHFLEKNKKYIVKDINAEKANNVFWIKVNESEIWNSVELFKLVESKSIDTCPYNEVFGIDVNSNQQSLLKVHVPEEVDLSFNF